MDLLVNDLSIHEQFQDVSAFRDAVKRVMTMRQVARKFGRELHCHRNLTSARVGPKLILLQAIQGFTRDERRVLMQWLTQRGPFWEDMRLHRDDDYLECAGVVVTNTAVGEAAYCRFHGIDRCLVSFAPSSWTFSPVPVTWVTNGNDSKTTDVINHWEVERLEAELRAAPAPIESWAQLQTVAIPRFPNLTFLPTCFNPLQGCPFSKGASQRLLVLLGVLDRLKVCFDEHGAHTPEWNRIFQEHFTGDKAWFTDSSASEKRDFRAELTFRHPTKPNESLFCTWHGKVKTPQLRIHFSWPVRADEPLLVVYVGPKITKR